MCRMRCCSLLARPVCVARETLTCIHSTETVSAEWNVASALPRLISIAHAIVSIWWQPQLMSHITTRDSPRRRVQTRIQDLLDGNLTEDLQVHKR